MDCSTPSFPVLHNLLEFAQTHVYWVNDAIQSTHLLLYPSPPALQFCSVQSLSHVWLFATPWTAAHQTSCPSPAPGACSNSCPLNQCFHPTISPSAVPLSTCLLSFPAPGSFLRSQFFASGGQSIGPSASASTLPINIQDWFPLVLTGWIFLKSKGLSKVFFKTTVQKHQFFGTQLFYGPSLTSIHDFWKNHSFDYMNFCWQSDISAF